MGAGVEVSVDRERAIRRTVMTAVDSALDRAFAELDRSGYTSEEVDAALTFHDVDLVEAWRDWSDDA
jgi:hypothetical protein